jgi:hypothetical protein
MTTCCDERDAAHAAQLPVQLGCIGPTDCEETEKSMSAANTASQPARRNGAPQVRTMSPTGTRPAHTATQPARLSFASKESEPELKLNLADIPRAQETLEVEGFKPTLLSRLFDLFMPK